MSQAHRDQAPAAGVRSGEADLLLSTATPGAAGLPGAIDSRSVAMLEWPDVLDAAEFHSLTALLYARLDGAHEAIPEDVVFRLRQAYVDSAKRNLFLTTRLLDLLGEFDAANIP